MRRVLLLWVALLTLVAGCAQAPVRRAYPITAGLAADPAEAYVLCGYAMDAVRTIITELLTAPDDPALVRQTTLSYAKYASRLRELALLATNEARRALILDAADAADAYADEVQARHSYNVNLQPVIDASNDAFPGCDLDG